MKGKSVSPSVAIILGKGPKGPAPKDDAMAEEEGGEEWSSFGKAIREAMESKDDAALGKAVKDIVDYCQPEAAGGEDE
jgi:hypothetical protein